jgi:hypothetical protein
MRLNLRLNLQVLHNSIKMQVAGGTLTARRGLDCLMERYLLAQCSTDTLDAVKSSVLGYTTSYNWERRLESLDYPFYLVAGQIIWACRGDETQ